MQLGKVDGDSDVSVRDVTRIRWLGWTCLAVCVCPVCQLDSSIGGQ